MDDSFDWGPRPLGADQFFERVDRNTASSEMAKTLRLYGVEGDDLNLVNSVWERKNQLFTALGKEEDDKLFHNESHTNRTVVLTSWALMAAKKDPSFLNGEITPVSAKNLMIAAISHDWGYLKSEGENVSVDFSVHGDESHEDRSKKQIREFLTGQAAEDDIGYVERYIESTKSKYPRANGIYAEDKDKLVRWADLLAGGITIRNDATYRNLMRRLAYEYLMQNPDQFPDIETTARSIISLDQKDFFKRVTEETKPFINLLATLGNDYDLAPVIAWRVASRIGETSPKEEAPLANIAKATRILRDQYLEIFRPLGKDYGVSAMEVPVETRKEVNKRLTEWVKDNYTNEYLNRFIAGYSNATDQRLTDKEKQELEITKKDLEHDLNVATQFLRPAFNGEILYDHYKHFIHPVIVAFPAEILERFARCVEGKKVIENFDPQATTQEMVDFFRIYLTNTPGTQVNFTPLGGGEGLKIKGDRLDLKTAVFNVMRNAQKRISNKKGNNLFVDISRSDHTFKIMIKDDTGGFEANLLEPVTGSDTLGRDIQTQRALVRGVTIGDESGSGLGLDITRRIIEDEFKGKVLLRNEVSKESGKTMGVVEFDIPV